MRADLPLANNQPSSRLTLAGQGSRLLEKNEIAIELVQSRSWSHVTGCDDQAAPLKVADHRTCLPTDQEPSVSQSATGAIRGASAADHGQIRCIEFGGQFRAGVAIKLHEGVPGSGNPRRKQPLSGDAFEPDVPCTEIQPPHQLGIDLMVVPKFGNHDRRRLLGQIIFHRPPRPPWPYQAVPAQPPGHLPLRGIHRPPERGGDSSGHSSQETP